MNSSISEKTMAALVELNARVASVMASNSGMFGLMEDNGTMGNRVLSMDISGIADDLPASEPLILAHVQKVLPYAGSLSVLREQNTVLIGSSD